MHTYTYSYVYEYVYVYELIYWKGQVSFLSARPTGGYQQSECSCSSRILTMCKTLQISVQIMITWILFYQSVFREKQAKHASSFPRTDKKEDSKTLQNPNLNSTLQCHHCQHLP